MIIAFSIFLYLLFTFEFFRGVPSCFNISSYSGKSCKHKNKSKYCLCHDRNKINPTSIWATCLSLSKCSCCYHYIQNYFLDCSKRFFSYSLKYSLLFSFCWFLWCDFFCVVFSLHLISSIVIFHFLKWLSDQFNVKYSRNV